MSKELVELKKWLTDSIRYADEDADIALEEKSIDRYSELTCHLRALEDVLGKVDELIEQAREEEHKFVGGRSAVGVEYVSRCTCKWFGGWYATYEQAESSWDRHAKEVLG